MGIQWLFYEMRIVTRSDLFRQKEQKVDSFVYFTRATVVRLSNGKKYVMCVYFFMRHTIRWLILIYPLFNLGCIQFTLKSILAHHSLSLTINVCNYRAQMANNKMKLHVIWTHTHHVYCCILYNRIKIEQCVR